MMVDGKENFNEQWNDDKHDPGAFAEFGNSKNNHDNRCTNSAKSIDQHLKAPALVVSQYRSWLNNLFPFFKVAALPPAFCHANLGQSE